MERVLIFRVGSLGDTVVALPCFHLIERAFPEAERIVLTNFPVSSKEAPVEAILKGGGFIHGAISYPGAVRSPVTLARLARTLRRLRAQTLVYLSERKGLAATRRDVAYFKLCGFRNIVGAPLTPDLLAPRVDGQGEVERESRRLGRTLAELGTIDFDNRAWWDLRLTELEQARGREALGALVTKPFIAANTGGKAMEKDWGEANWASLLARLVELFAGHGLAFVGAPDDRKRAEQLGAQWSAGPVVDLCGRLEPRESAAALCHADLFISHDSGALHLADAVGTPSVGLFGEHNKPKRWHPSGERTRIIHCMQGLGAITPERVVDTAWQLVREVRKTPVPGR